MCSLTQLEHKTLRDGSSFFHWHGQRASATPRIGWIWSRSEPALRSEPKNGVSEKFLIASCEVCRCPGRRSDSHTESGSSRSCINAISGLFIKKTWAAAWAGCKDVICQSLSKISQATFADLHTQAFENSSSKTGDSFVFLNYIMWKSDNLKFKTRCKCFGGSVPVGHTPHLQDSKRIISPAGVTPFFFSSCRFKSSDVTFSPLSLFRFIPPSVPEHEQHHHLSPGQPAERRPEGRQRGKATRKARAKHLDRMCHELCLALSHRLPLRKHCSQQKKGVV